MFPPETQFLVIDDFTSVRDLIAKSLKSIGYSEIAFAESGEQALNMLNNQSIDFIISDWGMPGMSGLDLLKKCKANQKLKNIPFIILAAESDQAKIVQAARAGVSDYIVKPVDENLLREKIEKVFLKSKAA